jgi:hypothetical protein
MLRRLKMVDPREYKIAGLAMAFGWGAKQLMAFWLALPWSAQTVIQGLITFALGLGALIAQHFLRRYLNRNWPEQAPPQNGSSRQGEAPSRARVDLFDLFRRGMARIRSKRRRKAS